jgi:hypothetical protein
MQSIKTRHPEAPEGRLEGCNPIDAAASAEVTDQVEKT